MLSSHGDIAVLKTLPHNQIRPIFEAYKFSTHAFSC